MSKSNNSPLVSLVRSLTKAEKRHFKLYARRTFGDKNMKFITLFDLIDKHGQIPQSTLKKRFPESSDSALSNLKSHLYEQLLISLRLQHHLDPSIRIYELINFAKVLYAKGLYLQSLEQLKRAKSVASELQDNSALYSIGEMERKIELFFVTRSGENRANLIVENNLEIRQKLESTDDWANLALMLYDYYLRYGHVKNQRQFNKVQSYFNEQIENIHSDSGIHASIHKHMAYTWFHFISQKFLLCFKHAINWKNEMETFPQIIEKDPILYLKGIHNVLSALFYLNKPTQFKKFYDDLQDFLELNEASFDNNTLNSAYIYRYINGLNLRFLNGKFRNNEEYIAEIDSWLSNNDDYIDENRIQVFNYKIACLYFGADEFKKCIFYLNRIINTPSKESMLRQDVQCFARILNLVAHYELENDDLVDYQLKSTYRFLIKYGDLQKVQVLIIDFIRKSVFMNRHEMTPHFEQLHKDLLVVFDDPFERRPLLYLDLISWLQSRISGKSVESIIRKGSRTKLGES